MAAEVVFLEELFIVVRHSYQIELGETKSGMDPCWMNVPMNHSLFVDVC